MKHAEREKDMHTERKLVWKKAERHKKRGKEDRNRKREENRLEYKLA